MRSISKAFGPTVAVDGVDLDLLPGDIHGLVGENGAGKSTLMRVLSGFYADYAGEIVVDGRAVRILSPGQARALGIGLVHQELSLVPELTVADNIFLGREPPARLPGFIDLAASSVQARRLCAELGVHLHPDARVARLSIAERQLVEIAKGVALVAAMVRRDPSSPFPRRPADPGAIRLEGRDLGRPGAFHRVSFAVRSGEVLGVYGLMGSGRTAVAEALFGLAPAGEGDILIDGARVGIRSPLDAIAHGIAMTPEDRRVRGLVPMLPVRTNLSLRALRVLSRMGLISSAREYVEVQRMIETLAIRAASHDVHVSTLSGGNQQKIVIGRWLVIPPKVLILDAPTRGIDVGAKAEVHAIIDRLAGDGLAVLFISSELPEILGMSDRILVMRNGTLVGEFSRRDATEERIMAVAAGVAGEGKAS